MFERIAGGRVVRTILAWLLGSAVVVATAAVRSEDAHADPVVPIIFPVAGPVHYSNDYGAPRSGGRTHGGIDIFGNKLQRLIATENGYINWWLKNTGLSGNMLELVGDSGYKYWYIHINNDNPGTDDGAGGDRWAWAPGIEPGARVRAGQFIGYLGDSGNAENTPPHLHFEIHHSDGVRFNPYESLNAATRWEEPDPTGGFAFHQYLTVQNPGPHPGVFQPRFITNDGGAPVDGPKVDIPARSRRTVRVNNVVPHREVSTELSSTVPVVAERPMYFMYGYWLWTGGHDGLGLQGPRTETYFAEGYTGSGFEEYITLGNPSDVSAAVTIDFLIRAGVNRSLALTVPANRRVTINVRDHVGNDKQVAATVKSTIPILAERPMYFDYNGWTGGHVTAGVGEPSTSFFFAEGYTGTGFDEYLTVSNPQNQMANLEVEFQMNGGSPIIRNFTVGPETRETFNVRDYVGSNRELSIKLASDRPVVAERPMYFRSTAWSPILGGPTDGGHASIGATSPQNEWLFAEGYTGTGFQEYLTIQNPNVAAANVTVEFQGQAGVLATRSFPVAGRSRFTVDVNGVVGPNREVSMRVTSDQPVVAERPMYFRYLGIWSGGHVSPGATAPDATWYFAEGYTG